MSLAKYTCKGNHCGKLRDKKTMKQRTCISPVESNGEEEMQAAAILLGLSNLIKAREDKIPPLPTWGTKRKRSINFNLIYSRSSSSPPMPPSAKLEPPPPPTAIKETDEFKKSGVKGETTSPATPLTFNLSEYNDKSKRVKRKLSVKKTKQQWLEIVKEYTQSNELLTKKIEQAKLYYEQLKERNLWLQTRKQELSCNTRREKLEIGVKESSRPAMEDQPSTTASDYGVWEVGDGRPMTGERTGNGVEVRGNDGEVVGEYSQKERNKSSSKFLAAQARQRRMQICRVKCYNSNIKLRLCHK